MRIRWKLLIGFGVTVLLMIAIGWVSYNGTYRLIDTSHRITRAHEILQGIESVLSAIKDAETGQRGYLLTEKAEYLEPYSNGINQNDQAIATLKRLTSGEKEQASRIENLEDFTKQKFSELAKTIELTKAGKKPEALELVKSDQGKQFMDEIRKIVDQMRSDERTILKERDLEATATASFTTLCIVFGTIAALVVTSITGLVVARSITKPLHALVSAAARIGQGDLQSAINVRSRDEVGDLAEAIRKMTGDLRSSMVNVEVEKASRERVENLLGSIREAVARLTSATTEILASTSQQASGAQEQAAAITETVSTVDEITQTAAQAAERAKGVGDSVQRTIQIGKAGRDAVESSITAMNQLKERVESTAENILMLAEQAQAIGEIISTVNDIADQTNILALNAAIEASRAGEHGKGFAVVAGEVKALADQSKRATQQVRQILGEIQKATNTAVLSTEEVTKGVASAIKMGAESGVTINSLADTLTDVSQASAQIVASAGQQATGMSQINLAMKNLDQVARQYLVATRQVEQAAQNLNSLGTQLAGLTR
ncbi:methyl-accepting chemotaxis protein [Singulisphaera sp. PoT]|uniref:methyl-accepting chemotaxis protein n=1 Tax=Singulisphaera sp. PoT TaxID=3411797 RepID=UPI003BF4E427